MRQIKLILKPIGVILAVQGVFMGICGAAALYFGERESFFAFAKTVGVLAVIAGIIYFLSRGSGRGNLSIRSGFLFVTFVWIFVSFFGSFPYVFSGAIPAFEDAFFESVSGFTTTGSSVLSDVESLPKSVLLWRGLTHWLGGGGIIVLSVAILPLLGVGGMHLMKAETSGVKLDKVTPRINQTAKYLWFFYVGITVVLVILLLLGGMNVLDALCQAFSAISTGGLSSRNASVAYFDSAYIDWVLTVFMLIGAMNFVLVIRVLRGEPSYLKSDSEFKAFIGIFAVATAIVAFSTYGERYDSISDTIRYSAFQVSSILTTTGFATDDYMKWPPLGQAVIFLLLFIGGCSGSTSGGIKVIRYVVMFKQVGRGFKYLVHPRGVFTFRLNGQPAETGLVSAVAGFFFLYVAVALIATLLVAAGGVDLVTSFTAVLGTLGTTGPGFGEVGPTSNFGSLNAYVKYVLCGTMLLGRLELFTILVLFTPAFWKK